MGKSALDFDDVQAEENRRREVKVLAGASPRATKYEPSPLKDMILGYAKETRTSAQDELGDYKKNTALPGYNFVASQEDVDSAKELREERERIEDLVEEANEHEYEVTDTSTGLPKAEPVLSDEEKEIREKQKDARKKQRDKERKAAAEAESKTKTQPPVSAKTPVQPSPAGSGDIRSASGAQEAKK